jgi:hypothetical protein
MSINYLAMMAASLATGFCWVSSEARAASPEYCTVYAHASSDPEGAAAASADDTEALQRAYDKAYYECLNLDDEPKLPADFADRTADPPGVGEGDISTGDEQPVMKKQATKVSVKKTASVEKPRRKKWRSGLEAGTPEWVNWCTNTYKSFDPKTGLYKSYSGEMKSCK